MKIYHVETQQDYDALMIELEEKGCEWRCVEKPTKLDKFKIYGKDTYIYEEYGIISLSDGYYSKVYRSNETLIEYKAKGEDMTQEEMNKNTLDWATDVSASIESFARGTLVVEADLKEAKTSAKKLIEKIDEYFETLKPKFKVGDYATFDIPNNKKIAKINGLNGDVLHGLWYDTESKIIEQDFYLVGGITVRHATPEEIAEYESALTFYKHGRNPFEVKKGDLIRLPSGKIDLVYYPEDFANLDFVNRGWEFLKTAEEVNEWLENK